MIWVIGSKGMLGAELCDQLCLSGWDFVGTDLEVNILDAKALKQYAVCTSGINAIVNCSAYTAVDKAEDEKELAFAINAEGVKNIAAVAAEIGAVLIHISTDYVFPGTVDRPLLETDATGPTSVYGASKLRGEELMRDTWDKHIIIRTAWLYGKHGNNFVYSMLKLMNTKDRLTVVNDQFGSPTNAADLAKAIIDIISSEEITPGTYHYSGMGRTTWYDFACWIQKCAIESGIFEKKCDIDPVSSEQYPTKANRPRFSLLDSGKIERQYKILTRKWDTSVAEMLKQLSDAITIIRTNSNAAYAALESAKVLMASGLPQFVPFLCSESIRYLLSGLVALKNTHLSTDALQALARHAPFAFQSSEISLMDDIEESRKQLCTGRICDISNESAGDVIKRCIALYTRMMDRTVLSI